MVFTTMPLFVRDIFYDRHFKNKELQYNISDKPEDIAEIKTLILRKFRIKAQDKISEIKKILTAAFLI